MLILMVALAVCILEIATKGFMFFMLAPLSLLCLPFFIALQIMALRREMLSPRPGSLRRARLGQLASVVTFYIVAPASSGAFSSLGSPVTQFGFVRTADGSWISILATVLALLAGFMMLVTTLNLARLVITHHHRPRHASHSA